MVRLRVSSRLVRDLKRIIRGGRAPEKIVLILQRLKIQFQRKTRKKIQSMWSDGMKFS